MIVAVGKRIVGMPHLIEGTRYNYTKAGGHLLLLSFNQPDPQEIEAVKRGKVELRVLGNDLALLVLFRIVHNGEPILRWSDAPYEYFLNRPDERCIPEEDDQSAFTIVLLDTATQVVQALRVITPDEAFQRALNKGIREQALRTREPVEGETQRYLAFLNQFPSADLAALAASYNKPDAVHSPVITFARAMASFRSGKTGKLS
jgi:hypothetical protein